MLKIYNRLSLQQSIRKKMLSFSNQNVVFEYNDNNHLLTKLQIKNNSLVRIYYKFKVNRPRYYLVKPDRGVIEPNQTIQIVMKLHKEGISEASTDKFKCFFAKAGPDRDMEKFQQKSDTEHRKLFVIINNLPPGLESNKQIPAPMGSSLKSLSNTRVNAGASQRGSTSYENTVEQRRARTASLTNQIERLETQNKLKRSEMHGLTGKKSGGSWSSLLGIGIFGLVLGVVSSFWI